MGGATSRAAKTAVKAPPAGPPEMDPAVLKAFYEAMPVKKTEVKLNVADAAEEKRRRSRFSKLQRAHNDATPPPGRFTQTELSDILSWRAHHDKPPVDAIAQRVGSAELARSLLVNFGTPQISSDKSGFRSGTWVSTGVADIEES